MDQTLDEIIAFNDREHERHKATEAEADTEADNYRQPSKSKDITIHDYYDASHARQQSPHTRRLSHLSSTGANRCNQHHQTHQHAQRRRANEWFSNYRTDHALSSKPQTLSSKSLRTHATFNSRKLQPRPSSHRAPPRHRPFWIHHRPRNRAITNNQQPQHHRQQRVYQTRKPGTSTHDPLQPIRYLQPYRVNSTVRTACLPRTRAP